VGEVEVGDLAVPAEAVAVDDDRERAVGGCRNITHGAHVKGAVHRWRNEGAQSLWEDVGRAV